MKTTGHQHEDAVLMATARTARCIGCLPGAPTPDWAKQLAQILLDNDSTGAIHVSVATLGKPAPLFECKGFVLGADAPSDPDSERQLPRLARAAMRVLPIPTGPVVWTIGELLAMHETSPRRHGFLRKRSALLMGFVPLSVSSHDDESEPLGLLILWDRPGEAFSAKLPDPKHNEILTRDDCIRMLRSLLPMIGRRLELALQGAEHRAPWLSQREHSVLMMLAQGMSVPQIAGALGRSPYTIRDYVKNLHRKLGTTSRGTLIARTLGQSDIAIDTITHPNNAVPVFGPEYQTPHESSADEKTSALNSTNMPDSSFVTLKSAELRAIMLYQSRRWASYLDIK